MSTAQGPVVLDWKGAFAAGVAACGGKGWNLARLDRYGFPVPAGCVLLAQGYREFVSHNSMEGRLRACAAEMEGTDPSGDRALELSGEMRRLFLSGEMPPTLDEELFSRLDEWGLSPIPLAVRSSGVSEDSPSASFAGIHFSALNVRGPDAVVAAVKDCWASVWTPRAVAYRRKMSLAGEPDPPAVVIMAMVEAAASGVAFTCHPGSGREDQVLISANFGLGESVVGGTADPDEYTVDVGFHALQQSLSAARTGRKEKRSVFSPGGGTSLEDSPGEGERRVLPDGEILRLARLVRRVYCVLGAAEVHQDVEWAFDGRRFHLLQSRPVTAVPRYTYPGLRGQPTVWTNANFRDTFPGVIPPLSWTNMTDALDTVLKSVVTAAGYPALPGVSRKRLYRGRGYFNVSVTQWENYDCFASPPASVNALLGGHHPAIALPRREPWTRQSARIRRSLVFIRKARRVSREVGAQFERLARRMEEAGRRDLALLCDAELLEFWAGAEQDFRESRDVHFALVGSAAAYIVLTLLLDRYFPGRGKALANALLAGGETTTSADHGYRLVELSRVAASDPAARAFLDGRGADRASWREALPETSLFRRRLEAFLEEFGHRGTSEWDLRIPRWREDQSWILDVVRANLEGVRPGGIEELRRRQGETAEQARREVFARVPRILRGYLRRLLAGASRETVQREMARSTLARVVGLGRVVALECARRLVARGLLRVVDDVFFLTWDELQGVLTGEDDGGGLAARVRDRRARHVELEILAPPDYLEEDSPHRSAPEWTRDGRTLAGLGVAAGRAAGPARLVRSPGEGGRLLEGDVLVAPATDPAWTPLFLRASALVMETGGIISHGAIVAREYGIPAVINVPGVLQVVADGSPVLVDGDAGTVRIGPEEFPSPP